MNIQTILSYLFVKGNFRGMLALSWGFMLGGCLLMTAVTYGTAFAGFSRLGVALCQIAVLGMVLLLAWMAMNSIYQYPLDSIHGLLWSFLQAVFISAIMPILLILAIYIVCREIISLQASSEASPRGVRGKPVGFWQDVIGRFFLKVAH